MHSVIKRLNESNDMLKCSQDTSPVSRKHLGRLNFLELRSRSRICCISDVSVFSPQMKFTLHPYMAVNDFATFSFLSKTEPRDLHPQETKDVLF